MTTINSLNDAMIRLKNSQYAQRSNVDLNYSNLLINVLKILRKCGYIKGFKINERLVSVCLKYSQDSPAISEIKTYSSLDSNNSVSYKKLKALLRENNKNNGISLTLLSTSKGLLTDFECLKEKQGGHLILTIL